MRTSQAIVCHTSHNDAQPCLCPRCHFEAQVRQHVFVSYMNTHTCMFSAATNNTCIVCSVVASHHAPTPCRGRFCEVTMASARVFRAVKERGPLGAFQQFWKLRTFKFGKLVGVDSMGNHYYENAVEYPARACDLLSPIYLLFPQTCIHFLPPLALFVVARVVWCW